MLLLLLLWIDVVLERVARLLSFAATVN